jgi:Tol biopolymer transport system component
LVCPSYHERSDATGYECEVPAAFLIPAGGGQPRTVAPHGAESVALGWTTDGRAIVFPPKQPAGGSEWRPGTYIVSADGKQRIAFTTGTTPPLNPSVKPRTADEVIAAAAQ